MKKILFFVITFLSTVSFAQITQIDTLAMQNFDSIAHTPDWPFTGPVVYNTMGMSAANDSPSLSPTGIGGSRSWESTTQSGGLILTFTTIPIPAGYDSLRVHFNLAAMNLTALNSGGPDNLDYVLTEVSFNGGAFYNRLRIRGATTNDSYWPYSATGIAKVYYQPQSEQVFNPTSSGLQNTQGYSNCEIVFPGSVTSISIRMTGRSSSASDTWLVDNVILTGQKTIMTGIKAKMNEHFIKVYPNPVNDKIHISRSNSETTQLELFNALGSLVKSVYIEKADVTIDISDLESGVYFLKLDHNTKKIIKH
jgi:hypothetical protein